MTSVRRLSPLFSRSSGLVDPVIFQCSSGKPVKGQQVVGCVPEHDFDLEELAAEHASDDVELGVHVFGVGSGRRRSVAARIR